jgi:hypothetical protein
MLCTIATATVARIRLWPVLVRQDEAEIVHRLKRPDN